MPAPITTACSPIRLICAIPSLACRRAGSASRLPRDQTNFCRVPAQPLDGVRRVDGPRRRPAPAREIPEGGEGGFAHDARVGLRGVADPTGDDALRGELTGEVVAQ